MAFSMMYTIKSKCGWTDREYTNQACKCVKPADVLSVGGSLYTIIYLYITYGTMQRHLSTVSEEMRKGWSGIIFASKAPRAIQISFMCRTWVLRRHPKPTLGHFLIVPVRTVFTPLIMGQIHMTTLRPRVVVRVFCNKNKKNTQFGRNAKIHQNARKSRILYLMCHFRATFLPLLHDTCLSR